MTRRLLTPLVAVVLIAASLAAQSKPSVEQLLDLMGAYLVDYESQLSSVVADERFIQRVVYTRASTDGVPEIGRMPSESDLRTNDEQRRLESEIGFIRLPGGSVWLGFRDVRRINGREVARGAQSVSDLLASGADVMTKARAIAEASAAHNLGTPRTTNVPTAALEIIHPRNFAAHQFELRGEDTVRRTRVAVIGFTEVRRPPLVTNLAGKELVSRGRIWVDPSTGAIWRVEWIYAPAVGVPSSLRVEFDTHDKLGMLVPLEMREEFRSFGGLDARGSGVAYYTNFRRFGTGARMIPQLP
jgi:hypothetical protein